MKDRGFRYIAHLPSDVVLDLESQREMEAGGDGAIDPESLDLPDDPNIVYLSTLSSADMSRWEDAYWGDVLEGGSDFGCYYGTYEMTWGMDPFAPSAADGSVPSAPSRTYDDSPNGGD